MIFTERTITVVNDSATINKPLILYRGDKNIELKITIAESQFKFRNTDASNVIETTDASYAQLVINTPYNSPIFSDVAVTKNGAVIFVITEAMIDEIREVGAYEIQIRLLDDNKQSRASIPPVSNAIEIREPIAIEDGSAVDSNAVNVAKVNRALTTTSAPLEAFDSQGNYIKKTWGDGDPITDAALNKMEAGIDGVNKKVANNSSQIKDIENRIDNISTTGGGLSYNAKKAILDLFSAVAYYNKDITATYQVLRDALLVAVDSITLDKNDLIFTSATSQTLIATKSPAESEGTIVWTSSNTSVATVDNNGIVTATGNGECIITATCGSVYATCNVSVSGILATYTIVNNLTNVTTSNNIDNIAEGTGYIATLTANSNYIISSVTVTMGEEDITSTVYSNGAISISSVTGNVVITAIAVEDVGWISGVPYDITWTEGYTINSNDGSNTENSNFCVSDYLPCHGVNRLSFYDYKAYFYDENKNYLTMSETSFIPDTKNIHVPDTAYYVRVYKVKTNTTATVTPYLDKLLTDSTAYNTDEFYRLNWKDGYNINSSTGEETTSMDMSLSDFALCYGATLLQISYGGRMFIHCYDENKNYLGQVIRQNVTTATSLLENTKYFRLSVNKSTANFWVKLS